jgi:hypothetical protein
LQANDEGRDRRLADLQNFSRFGEASFPGNEPVEKGGFEKAFYW